MSSEPVLITGVPTTPGENGSVPLRRELRDLQANYPYQMNLLLLGLSEFQRMSKDDPRSYYQIAGIHGRPYKAWNNVTGIRNPDFGGYCTHSSILFATWHRPFLALFEQSLNSVCQSIARQFRDDLRDRFIQAADELRLPYFDWAARVRDGAPAFPELLAYPSVRLWNTDGELTTISNPLYQFDFAAVGPDEDDFDATWDVYDTTVRYPDWQGNSRNWMVERVLMNESASRRENVALLLLSPMSFDAFTNNAWAGPGNPGTYSSLEDVHNEIHDETGGRGGHMGALETSSFDPLFWLHHCNVDRLWAIWGDLNPDEWMTPHRVRRGNFFTQSGAIEDENSPLVPFWDETGNDFWTSARVRQTTTFGYAYPETQAWQYSDSEQYRRELRRQVTAMYGGNVFRNFEEVIAPRMSLAAATPAAAAATATEVTTETVVAKEDDETTVASKMESVTMTEDPSTLVAEEATVVEKTSAEGTTRMTLAATSTTTATGSKKGKTPAMTDVKLPASQEPDDDQSKPEHPVTEGAENPIVENKVEPTVPDDLARLAPDNKYNEYITNVRAIKHGLGQTFRVIIFLRDFDSDPSSWDLEFNVVGRVTILGRRPGDLDGIEGGCDKCRDDLRDELVATGTVPLTSALLQDVAAGHLASLNHDDVVPYLAENLHWKVSLFDGTEKDPAEVPGLKVSVTSVGVTIDGDGVPEFDGVYQTHPAATAGKDGGLEEGDDE